MDYQVLTTEQADLAFEEDLLTTTLEPVIQGARVLRLYDIFIPLLGAFIIVLNLAVVVSSGLILKRGKFDNWNTQFTLIWYEFK